MAGGEEVVNLSSDNNSHPLSGLSALTGLSAPFSLLLSARLGETDVGHVALLLLIMLLQKNIPGIKH